MKKFNRLVEEVYLNMYINEKKEIEEPEDLVDETVEMLVSEKFGRTKVKKGDKVKIIEWLGYEMGNSTFKVQTEKGEEIIIQAGQFK